MACKLNALVIGASGIILHDLILNKVSSTGFLMALTVLSMECHSLEVRVKVCLTDIPVYLIDTCGSLPFWVSGLI